MNSVSSPHNQQGSLITSDKNQSSPSQTISFNFKRKKHNNTTLPLNVIVQSDELNQLSQYHLVPQKEIGDHEGQLPPTVKQRKETTEEFLQKTISDRFNIAKLQESKKIENLFNYQRKGEHEIAKSSDISSKNEIEIKEICDIDSIDYSRFFLKEGGRKVPSQSQLLFEQLKKKAAANHMGTSTFPASNQQNNIFQQQCFPAASGSLSHTFVNPSSTTISASNKVQTLLGQQSKVSERTSLGLTNSPIREPLSSNPENLLSQTTLSRKARVSNSYTFEEKISKDQQTKLSLSHLQSDQSALFKNSPSLIQKFPQNVRKYSPFLLSGSESQQELQQTSPLKQKSRGIYEHNVSSTNLEALLQQQRQIENNKKAKDREKANKKRDTKASFTHLDGFDKQHTTNQHCLNDSSLKNFSSLNNHSINKNNKKTIQLAQTPQPTIFHFPTLKQVSSMMFPQIQNNYNMQEAQQSLDEIGNQVSGNEIQSLIHKSSPNLCTFHSVISNNFQKQLPNSSLHQGSSALPNGNNHFLKTGNFKKIKYSKKVSCREGKNSRNHNQNGDSISIVSGKQNQKNIIKSNFDMTVKEESQLLRKGGSPLEKIYASHSQTNAQNYLNGRQSRKGSTLIKLNSKLNSNLSLTSFHEISSVSLFLKSQVSSNNKEAPYHGKNQADESQFVSKFEMESVISLILAHFQSKNFIKYHQELKDLSFKSTFFEDLIERIIYSISNHNKQQSLKFSFIKEQLKTLGITPQKTQYIVSEIEFCLEENKIQNHKEICQQFSNYFEHELNWTLLDYFGSDSDLREISEQLFTVLQSDTMCQKLLLILQINKENIYEIVYSAFTKDNIDQSLLIKISMKIQFFEQSNINNNNNNIDQPPQKMNSQRGRSIDLTYADFFYAKYRIHYFLLEHKISNRIIYSILQKMEFFRQVVIKLPLPLNSNGENDLQNQFKRLFASKIKLTQQLQEKGLNSGKIEFALASLAKQIVNRQGSFFPAFKLPYNLGEIFTQLPEVLSLFETALLEVLSKCEKYVYLDSKLILSTLQISAGIKQSLNQSIISGKSLEELFQKLIVSFEESQTFKMFTQLSDPVNLNIFTFNLLCYLFDVYSANQPCIIFTLDIQAQFKMFGCNFVAFNEFLILLEKQFEPHFPAGFFDGFIHSACKGLKGLDIFD